MRAAMPLSNRSLMFWSDLSNDVIVAIRDRPYDGMIIVKTLDRACLFQVARNENLLCPHGRLSCSRGLRWYQGRQLTNALCNDRPSITTSALRGVSERMAKRAPALYTIYNR